MTASDLPPAASPGLFVTGTDTGCGKTRIAAGIISRLRSRELRVAGMKPVASGCERRDGDLRNADAEALIAAADLDLPYAAVNPFAFEPPIAPHLAAEEADRTIDLDAILEAYRTLRGASDLVVVEGVGGWAVPLGGELMLADLARALALPVVLVVGLRLGCLNHAQLAARAIQEDGLKLAGWIGNAVDPDFERPGANLAALRERLKPVPCLGVVDFHDDPTPERIAAHLRPDKLMDAAGYRPVEAGSADDR